MHTFYILSAGWTWENLLMFLCAGLLLAIGIADEKSFEIPLRYNLALGSLGIVNLIFHFPDWKEHVTGMCLVSGFLLLLYLFTKGKGIGGGDIKLMAAAGLFLGWPKIFLAFFLGAALGALIHPLRMLFGGKNKIMALGPYFSLGIFISMVYGEKIMAWYFM